MKRISSIILMVFLSLSMLLAQEVQDSLQVQEQQEVTETPQKQQAPPNPFQPGSIQAKIYEREAKKKGYEVAPADSTQKVDSVARAERIWGKTPKFLTFGNGCTVDIHGGASINNNLLKDGGATMKYTGWYVAADINIPFKQVQKWTMGLTASILFVGKYYSTEYRFVGGSAGGFMMNQDYGWIERPVYMEYTARAFGSWSHGSLTIMPGLGIYAGVGIGGKSITRSYSHITGKGGDEVKDPFDSKYYNRGEFGLDLDLQILIGHLIVNIEGEIAFINHEKGNNSRSSKPHALLLGLGWRL